MSTTVTQLYERLSQSLNRSAASQLTEYIDLKVDQKVQDKIAHLASREDLAQTKAEMIKWFVGLFIVLALMLAGLYFKP